MSKKQKFEIEKSRRSPKKKLPQSQPEAATEDEPVFASGELSPPINASEDLYRADKIAEAGTTTLGPPSTSSSSSDGGLSVPKYMQRSERNAGTFAVIKVERDKGNIHFRLRADIDPGWMIQQHHARQAAIEAAAETERKLAQVAEFKRKSSANHLDRSRRRHKITATAAKSGDEQQVRTSEEPLKQPKSGVKLIRAVPKSVKGRPSLKTHKKEGKAPPKISKAKAKVQVKKLPSKSVAGGARGKITKKLPQKGLKIAAKPKLLKSTPKAAKKVAIKNTKTATLRSPHIVKRGEIKVGKVSVEKKTSASSKSSAESKSVKNLNSKPVKIETLQKTKEKLPTPPVKIKQKSKGVSSKKELRRNEKEANVNPLPRKKETTQVKTKVSKEVPAKIDAALKKEVAKIKETSTKQVTLKQTQLAQKEEATNQKSSTEKGTEKLTNTKLTENIEQLETSNLLKTNSAPSVIENILADESAIECCEDVFNINTSQESAEKNTVVDLQQSPDPTIDESSSKSSEVESSSKSADVLRSEMEDLSDSFEQTKLETEAELDNFDGEVKILVEQEDLPDQPYQANEDMHQSVSIPEDEIRKYSYQKFHNYNDDSPIDDADDQPFPEELLSALTDEEFDMIKEKMEEKKRKLKQVKLAEYNNQYQEDRSDWQNFAVDMEEIDISEELIEILQLRRKKSSTASEEEAPPAVEIAKAEHKKSSLLKKKADSIIPEPIPDIEDDPCQFKLCNTCGWMVCPFDKYQPEEPKEDEEAPPEVQHGDCAKCGIDMIKERPSQDKCLNCKGVFGSKTLFELEFDMKSKRSKVICSVCRGPLLIAQKKPRSRKVPPHGLRIDLKKDPVLQEVIAKWEAKDNFQKGDGAPLDLAVVYKSIYQKCYSEAPELKVKRVRAPGAEVGPLPPFKGSSTFKLDYQWRGKGSKPEHPRKVCNELNHIY